MKLRTLIFLAPFAAVPAFFVITMSVSSIINPDEYRYIGKHFIYIGEGADYRVVVPVAETGDMVPCKVHDYYRKFGAVVVAQIATNTCEDIIESYTGVRGRYGFLKPRATYYWHLVGPNIIGPCLDEECKSSLVPR
jgi:hypothetical protein